MALSADAEGLLGECQCPRFRQSNICEHVVALGLAMLAATSPEEGPPPPPASEVSPPTPEAARAWMEANQVTHLRHTPLAELEPLLPHGFGVMQRLYLLDGYPISAVLEGSLELPAHWSEKARDTFRRAAWSRARSEAERVRLGLEHERANPVPPPPTDARLQPLVQQLQRVRARVREHAVPRLLPKDERLLCFPEKRPVAHVHEALDGLVRTHVLAEHVHTRCVRMDLLQLLEGDEGLAITCTSCNPRGPALCLHVLTALDLLLAALGDSQRAQENALLAERLFVAPARQFLAAMDKAGLLARTRWESRPGGQITFRLEGLHEGEPCLRPYLHRPLKRGGLSKGTQVALREENEARALLGSPEELEAFELCRLIPRLPHDLVERHRLLVQALKLLAHHPRLFLASRQEVPLRVRSVPLGFAIEEGEGGLRVRPMLGGEPAAAAVVSGLGRGMHMPQPWLHVEEDIPRVTLVSASAEALAVLEAVGEYGGRLPASSRAELLHRLGGVEAAFPVSLPPSLEAREVPPAPGLLVRLRPTGGEALEGVLLVRPLPEAPPLVTGGGGRRQSGACAGASGCGRGATWRPSASRRPLCASGWGCPWRSMAASPWRGRRRRSTSSSGWSP